MTVVSSTGITLLLGGARSGKSDLATRLGESWPTQVTFVATAEPLDDDMADRISRHRADRPASWRVLEAPQFSATDVATIPPDDLVIVDCLTMLTANLMLGGQPETDLLDHVRGVGQSLAARSTPTLEISNEVGMGVHPPTEMGREYRDLLGRVNRTIATLAESAILVVAGHGLQLNRIDATWPHVGDSEA